METTREADGLALSSRNVYLTADERKVAPALNRVLRDVAAKAHAAVSGLGGARTGKAPRPTPLVRDPTLPPQAHQLPDLDAICATPPRSCWRPASPRSTTSPCATPTR